MPLASGGELDAGAFAGEDAPGRRPAPGRRACLDPAPMRTMQWPWC